MAAVFAVRLDSPLFYQSVPTFDHEAPGAITYLDYAPALAVVGAVTPGSITFNAPKAADVHKLKSYGDDLFNKVHVYDSSYDLGNVLSNRTIYFDVWNAWLKESRAIESITQTDVIGLDLLPGVQIPPPDVVIGPQGVLTYQVEVSTVGPPQVAANYQLNIDNGEAPYTDIRGLRLALFPFVNNWEVPFIETMEWKTDVIMAQNGLEQRIGLRRSPRVSLRHKVFAYREDFRALQAYVRAGYERPFAIPLHNDQSYLLQAAPIGSTEFEVETTNRNFREGQIVAVMAGVDSYELAFCEGISGNTLTLQSETLKAWNKRTPVFPVELALIPAEQKIDKLSGEMVSAVIEWELVNSIPHAAFEPSAPELYNGYYVLTRQPNWRDSRDITYSGELIEFDPGTGKRYREKMNIGDRVSQPFKWFLNGRTEIEWFRSFLYYLDGRRVPFWLHSDSPDFVINDVIDANQSGFSVDGNYLSQLYGADAEDEIHVRILLHGGEVFYRRMVSAIATEVGTDWVEVTNPDGSNTWGHEIQPNQVKMCSFMHFVRNSADRIQLSWISGDFAECDLRFTYAGELN